MSIETSQFMLILYLKLSFKFIQTQISAKRLTLYKSYASAQSGNPDQS